MASWREETRYIHQKQTTQHPAPPTVSQATSSVITLRGSTSNESHRQRREAWKVHGEDAADAGDGAHPKRAAARLDAAPTNGQPESQSGPVGATLLMGAEQPLPVAAGEPPALIRHFD